MKEDFKIRPATKEDFPGLMSLYRHLIPDYPTLNEFDATNILHQLQKYNGSQILIGKWSR